MTIDERFDNRPKVKKLNVLPQNPEAVSQDKAVGPGRFPSWLHRNIPKGGALAETGMVLSKNRMHTVCEEAKCPNLLECWSAKTATFLAMGKQCTRNCGFCDIDFSRTPATLEEDEPMRLAEAVKELGLSHVVITMVARDDLEDGGSSHLVKIIEEVRNQCPGTTIEVLTSDFFGNEDALNKIIAAKPEIFNHNIETVRSLTPRIRHKATYERTLNVLSKVASAGTSFVKSGLMVGLGETEKEVQETLQDLKNAGCQVVTIGQYLQANAKKLRVKEFVHPDQFKAYEEFGHSIGISHVYSGPFVRSSYNAGKFFEKLKNSVTQ